MTGAASRTAAAKTAWKIKEVARFTGRAFVSFIVGLFDMVAVQMPIEVNGSGTAPGNQRHKFFRRGNTLFTQWT
jgi:hypothetical protein